MNIHTLRAVAAQEEIDYTTLKDALSHLAYPRDKISAFLRAKDLIRVKKGLYIFGPTAAREPYHPEVLANLIYGPSAISLEYALAFYGMIPERVEVITSITNKRDKYFSTPVGEFTYRYLNPNKYAVGITRVELDARHAILIATPEKAIADTLLFSCGRELNNLQELTDYLLADLRIETSHLQQLNLSILFEIATVYQNANVDLLMRYLSQ